MIKKSMSLLLFAAAMAIGMSTAGAQAQDEHAYTEGPVVVVSYIRALDNLNEKTDPIDRKVWGSISKAAEASAGRGKMRTEVGIRTLRELVLK